MEARLPQDKLQRICELILAFLDKKTCTKRQLLSLLGHLNFAMRVVHPGRSFISYLISLSTTVQDLNHFVTLNSDCRLDLHMWHKFLSQWNGTSFFLDDAITNAADMHLYTDATDSAFGGYYSGKCGFKDNFRVKFY
jgi:hypothetical protein